MKLINLIDRVMAAVSVVVIQSYQMLLAPFWLGGCRHLPTCSDYAIQALRMHGFRYGGVMAIKRILRCRPGGSFGYDPVEHHH